MNTLDIKNGPQGGSRIVLGCMRMPALSVQEAAALLRTAAEEGINFFDHATIYGDGEAETRFGAAFRAAGLKREDVTVQSKCGIHPERGEFDWTCRDILESVDGSLRRLRTEYLDVLLLHRPDLLFEPEEVAEAFERLERSGKVRFFGVSNVTPGQLRLLKKYVRQPLVINQLQFSLDQSQLVDGGLYLNNPTTERAADRDRGVLDYCRLHDITVQAWSPLQSGASQGSFVDHPDFPALNHELGQLGEQYGVSKSAVAIAWILRHPARMQAVVGTMNPRHLREICAAAAVELRHREWYRLYLASGKFLP